MNKYVATGICLVLLVSCATREPHVSSWDAQPAILIATEKSDFKQQVLSRITARFKQQEHCYKVLGLDELNRERAADYQVVILLNTIWAWKLRGNVQAFLDRTPASDRSRIILISTASGEDWQTKEKDLHAITSASKPAKVNTVSDYILSKTDELIRL